MKSQRLLMQATAILAMSMQTPTTIPEEKVWYKPSNTRSYKPSKRKANLAVNKPYNKRNKKGRP